MYRAIDRLYIGDLLFISTIVIINYVVYIDIWPKTFLFLLAVIISINLYFLRLGKSGITVPLWIIPLLGLTSLLTIQILESIYSLLILYTFSILLIIVVDTSTIRLLNELQYSELLIFLISTIAILSLLLHLDNLNWILLGPLTEFLLVKVISPAPFTKNFSIMVFAITILSSLLVSILFHTNPCFVVLALIMNSFKALAYKPIYLTLSLSADYLLRFIMVGALTWSIGIY